MSGQALHHDTQPRWSLFERLRASAKLLILRRVWGLDIGAGTSVHPAALIDRSWSAGVHVGRNCLFDRDAVLLTHDFTRGLLADTRVGDGCRIGARAVLMPGITLGDGVVVMPGAVVTRDVPAGHVAAGNPAVAKPIADALPG